MSSTSQSELDKYIDELERGRSATFNVDPEFFVLYQQAQIMQSQGHLTESLPLLSRAMEGARKMKNDFVWKRMYLSIGMLWAVSLDYIGRIDEAESTYNELLDFSPVGPFLGDYAVFLQKRKRDHNKAQSFFLKALEVYPEYSSTHLKYAAFLRHVRKDAAGAEKHYKLAVEANPLNAEALGSYASFLHGVVGNADLAEGFYKRAVETDDTHANNLCNYGLFLSEEKHRYDEAEKCYRRALAVSPKHANTLYNYGVMLDTHCNRKDEAESLYRRALNEEPRHSYALYNLAVLLEERLGQENPIGATSSSGAGELSRKALTEMLEERKREIEQLYERAVQADPRDSTTMADYGRYLLAKMNDHDSAESVLTAALQLNENCDVALFNLAVLRHRNRSDFAGAEALLRHLISPKVNPKHTAGMQQLARVIIDANKSTLGTDGSSTSSNVATSTGGSVVKGIPDEAMELYERILAILRDPGSVAVEYIKTVNSNGSNRQKLRAISTMEALLGGKKKELGSDKEREIRVILAAVNKAASASANGSS